MKIRKAMPLVLILSLAAMLMISPRMSADDAKAPGAAEVPPAEEQAVTQIYDIRGLMIPTTDFTFDNSPHAVGFVYPGILNFNSNSSGYSGGGGGNLFSGGEVKPISPTRAEMVAEIIKLITDSVAADTWTDNGGRLGSIRDFNGMLIVAQTPENHKLIAALLRDLQSHRDRTVRTTVDWVVIPHAHVGELLKSPAQNQTSDDVVPQIALAAVERLPANIRRFRAQMTCINGQTVDFVSGRERTVTIDQTATVGTDVSAYTPLVANIGGGIALQITPVAHPDTKSAVVTLLSTFTVPDKPGKPIGIRSYATTQASTGENTMVSESTATYRPLNGVVQELRTTAHVPLGVPVLVGEMSLEPTAKDGQNLELLLILTVHAAVE